MNLSILGSLYTKQRALILQLGFINACLYLANRTTQKFSIPLSFNKYYFVSQLLNPQPLLPKNKGSKLRIIELPPDAINPHPCPRPADVIADRYKQQASCLAAYKEQEFAGCLWYAKTRYKEDEVRCLYELVSPKTAWDFDVYVEPKFRLSPVFLKLWDTASSKLISEGYNWSFSRISAFNPLSLASHKRMGAKLFGWAVFIRLSALQLTLTSINPYFHLSFTEHSFPIFKLQPPTS